MTELEYSLETNIHRLVVELMSDPDFIDLATENLSGLFCEYEITVESFNLKLLEPIVRTIEDYSVLHDSEKLSNRFDY